MLASCYAALNRCYNAQTNSRPVAGLMLSISKIFNAACASGDVTSLSHAPLDAKHQIGKTQNKSLHLERGGLVQIEASEMTGGLRTEFHQSDISPEIDGSSM